MPVARRRIFIFVLCAKCELHTDSPLRSLRKKVNILTYFPFVFLLLFAGRLKSMRKDGTERSRSQISSRHVPPSRARVVVERRRVLPAQH